MTYGMLKRQISALLDLDTDAVQTQGSLLGLLNARISPAVHSAVRKTAVYLGGVVKQAVLSFVRDGDAVTAPLPQDFISALRLGRGGRTYGREAFVREGRSLRLSACGEGLYELTYDAYPAFTDMETDADREIGLDEFAAEAAAYGAAAELCQSIYPGDMTRYMRLATEFDERLVNAFPRTAEKSVSNTVFGKGRGLL